MTFETILLETDDRGISTLTINRPDKLNALSHQVLAEIDRAVDQMVAGGETRGLILTGAGGKAFVAGADIAEMRAMTPLVAQALAEKGGNLAEHIEKSAKVYIAAVNGFALGGGCELAMACDFIYASARAKLGQPEVKLGVLPGFGGTQRLLRRVGVAKCKELILTGAAIGADEALRIGLVDTVVEPEELMGVVRQVAGTIAANGPLAVAEAKRLIHVGQNMSLDDAILLEQRSFGSLFDTQDQKEGMAAFIDKRKAEFKSC